MVVQSLLPGSPEDLSAEGNRLQNISQAAVYPNPEHTPVTNTFNELCPACKVEVPLRDITTAVCDNGHRWGTFNSFNMFRGSLIYSCSSLFDHYFHTFDDPCSNMRRM